MPGLTNTLEPIERRLRLCAAGAGAVAACTGAFYLLAWLSGVMTYRGIHAITIKTNSALALFLCGTALLLVASGTEQAAARLLSRIFAALAMVIGALTLSEHIFGLELGIDQLLAREAQGALAVLHANRMGPPPAACFVLGGAAILLLSGRGSRGWRIAQWLGVLNCLIPLLGLVGYLYGVEGLYAVARFTGIAWPTTVALFVLGFGILCARPQTGLMLRVASPDPGGAAIRRLLPAAVVIPILLGWLRMLGEWNGLYQRYIGTSILVLSWMVVYSVVAYKVGSWITSSARARSESEERFRIAQELSPDGFTILRPLWNEEGRVFDFAWVYQNPTIARLSGTDPQSVVGHSLSEVLPGHAATVFHEVYCRVAETGEPAVIEAPYRGGTVPKPTWFRVAAVSIRGDIAVLAQDITEQKEAQDRLRLSEEKFAKAFASNPAAMGITRLADGFFLEVNDAWQVTFDYRREEVLGHTSLELDFWLPGRRERAVEELRAHGSLRNLEVPLRKRSGELRICLMSAEILMLGGELVGVWTIMDITDRKQVEEELRQTRDELEVRVRERTQELERTYRVLQQETEERLATLETLRKNEQLLLQQSRLAAMGEMLSNIAHQWRQPLNTLGLVLQDLPLSYELGELKKEYLDASVAKGMQLVLHMSHTIDDFRGFLQPEREKKRFNVNQAVAATLSLLEATLKSCKVEVEVRESGELFTHGFRSEFSQVIINLITNARDAFREKGTLEPRLVIALSCEKRPVVTITDNAGGIAEGIIDKVFDPYFTTKGPGGTGIGLFMSKNIIEKSMGGSLTVRNTGEGAEFRIEL